MVKQRMASADVAAEVACLRQNIIGLRLANMYDLNPKVRTQQQMAAMCEAPQGSLQVLMCTPMHVCNKSGYAAAEASVSLSAAAPPCCVLCAGNTCRPMS
jgi:hypothetical protein